MKTGFGICALAALTLAGCAPAAPEPPSVSEPPPVIDAPEAPEAPTAPEVADGPPAPPPAPDSPATPQMAVKSAAKSVTCGSDEKTVFSCKADNGKQIAVCMAKDARPEYRYGAKSSEITLSASQFAQTMYSGGNEVQLGFDNGDTRYVVFSRMIRTNFKAGEPNNPAISDGVVILKGGEFSGMRLCKADTSNGLDLNALDAALPRSEDLLTYETGRADERVRK